MFYGHGNLGAQPELKFVTVDGEQRSVCELRIYFDRRVPNADGEFEDRGGMWRDVSVWGKRGEMLARMLIKGVRVAVLGVEMEDRWTDRESGEERRRPVVSAESVCIDPICIETVIFKSRSAAASDESADTGDTE
jgi:single-strand DNA-binding protein